jgi:hypothetical protein
MGWSRPRLLLNVQCMNRLPILAGGLLFAPDLRFVDRAVSSSDKVLPFLRVRKPRVAPCVCTEARFASIAKFQLLFSGFIAIPVS